ncbi:AsmA family protein [Pontimicrobium sp. MEBiC01747]
MKKILKITGISLLVIIILLITAPFIFQSQIKDMVRNFINNSVNAKVEFADVNLSFLSSFPQANVTVDELKITNFKPFEDETLATVKSLSFDMSVSELFKTASEGPVIVNAIAVNEALVTLKTNKFGDVNYDIAKKDDKATSKTESKSGGFTLDIKDYNIKNSVLNYIDELAKTHISITELNHNGNGTFSETVSELNTKTNANISFKMDSTEYLSNNKINLEAIIGLDLENNKYTFKDNKAVFNNLPLFFKGYVQQLDNGQDVDITFENTNSSFNDFFALLPAAYTKNISNIETTGNFNVNGTIKGLVTDETIPTLDINITSKNAAFKYPDLPKRVENININAAIKNTTGKTDDTYVDLKALNFKIDQDVFKSSATLKNLTKNIAIDAHIDGILNLENITKAYPIELENELSGILKGNLNTAFDMKALETNAYDRIKNNGNVSISDFKFSSKDIVNPINISKADINFKPKTINLERFDATSGTTDLNANGTINNLLGFLLSDKKLKGNFNVLSNTFKVSDFMVEGGSDQPVNQSTEPGDALKIPAFLDCTINADAKTVLYDNLTLKDVKGTLIIKDEQANLQNVTSSIFDGNLSMSGLVDTKTKTPKFNMDLGISNFDISKSFNDLDLFKSLAPIAKALQGKLNSSISLSGDLGDDFTPALNTISGGALAELLTTKIEPKNAEVFNALKGAINFIDFDKLDIKDIQTHLKFNNGKVDISPFNFNYKDIGITVGGSHGFDQSMDYNLVLDVPAKYLGSDVNRLIGKINNPEVNKVSIPVKANIVGSFTKPKVSTDLTSGVSNLTKQLIEIEKQKLINNGKDKITDILGDALGGNKGNDSTKTTNNSIKEVFGNIIKGNKTKNDSTTTDSSNTKSNIVKDVFGIFGKKKKKDKQN